ncbi:MAG TPA: hybrid sensor histidine kinase/response regulator [Candidatus Wallbacteria bacterium]|nr:hybrid sensor histidine kinase/response regulator [Candidatus Wallbacteria bacterium]
MEKLLGKVLVIDDEDQFRIALTKVISKHGYEATPFPSAFAALDYLKDHHEEIDITVVDMKMDGMDGIEFITRINELYPTIVPIMVTAYSSIDTAVNSIKHGAFDFISKPFSPEQILYALQKSMTRRSLLVQNKKLKAEAERSLKILGQEKSKIHTVVQCMANPLIVLNSSLEIVLYNPYFENIDIKQRIKLFTKITDYDSEFINQIKALVNSMIENKTLTMIQKEFQIEEKFYQATCAAVITDHEIEGYCVVLNDITKLKEVENLKNQFVSMVAHEIKAPISASLGYIYLILDGYITDRDKILEKLGRCKERSETLLEMVNDLLQISRHQTNRLNLEIKPVNIREKIENALEFYAQEMKKKNLELTKEFSGANCEILADDKSLDMILNNLISNAIKYTPEGGKVSVSYTNDGDYGAIAVKDSGYGIRKEDLPRLFTEFFRCKTKETSKISGTGLGLSVVKKFVTAQKGTVTVDSEYQKGSVFTVRLPLSSEQRTENREQRIENRE